MSRETSSSVRRRNRRCWCAVVSLVVACAGGAEAVEKGSQQVSPFYGSFGYTIPIEVPAFHGLEPRMALGYSSEGRNGIAGVGWTLTGFSTIERANAGRGTPRFDANDIYLLDGQELVACVGGSVSPSCTSGGTHSTKIESYLKIRFDSPTNQWTVWGKDGTRTIYSPIIQLAAGTFRWGQTSVIDTKSNTVTYSWTCSGGDCYPHAIDYNGYEVYVFLEPRTDTFSSAAYSQLIQTLYRVRSIFVWLPGTGHIRAYKLSYTTSPLTGRSLLASVQQYGKDVDHNGAGLITTGTSLPAQTFTYQDDIRGKTFQNEAPDPPSAPGTVENVVWANRVNAYAVAPGNSLQKSISGNAWNAGGSSTRAIASGDGYVQATASGTGEKAFGLSVGDTDTSNSDIDFGIYESFGTLYVFEGTAMYGPFGSVASGNSLKVDVQGGVVRYKKNGTTFYTSTKPPVYPLLVDAAIHTGYGVITNAVLSGSLQNANFWCQGSLLLTGDFNSDGRTDQLCYRTETQTIQVELATATGFGAPQTWLSGPSLSHPVVGDFNADGKADIADGPNGQNEMTVALSTGSAFNAFATWGTASGTGFDAEGHPLYGACTPVGAVTGTGDFNGDGITDVSCKVAGDNKIFIGLSNGASAFSFSIFAGLSCDVYEQTGAIDFDGDGKDDWYCIGMTSNALQVFVSTGTAFVMQAFGSLDGSFCAQPYYLLGDFNGDGRTDAACLVNGGKVALSTGHAFAVQGSYGNSCAGATNSFAADVDGDGASEIVCNVGGTINVRKWQAGALGPVETWKSGWCSTSVGAGDFNGDGKTDLLCNSQAVPVALAGTAAFQADLVSTVSNGLGGTIQPGYSPATAYPTTNVSKQVVASLATDDGRGGSATTTYSYSGGLMSPKERRFLGFRYVKETFPHAASESVYPYTETWLRQDLPAAGSVERVERRNEVGVMRRKEAYDYTTNIASVPMTSLLTGQWTYDYDGSGNECPSWPCAAGKRTYAAHQYDAYGNLSQTTFYGDNDASGDEMRTFFSYWPNTSAYIVNRGARQQQFSGVTGGNPLSDRVFWYDGAGDWSTPPSQGFVTSYWQWLDTEARWVRDSFLGYDAFGNLTSVTDGAGRTTTTTYDPTYHVFPKTVTNAASESATTLWDPVCGIPSQHTDANSQNTTMQSDALCRPTVTNLPLGNFATRSYVSIGNPNAQRERVEVPSATAGVNLYTDMYFDGFGRTYRTAKKGPAGAEILQDTIFNSRGLTQSQTAPYYAGSVSWPTTYTYNSLNRVNQIWFPDGYHKTISYLPWKETAADEHGHVESTSFDAYGRRILTEQFRGGVPIQTHYGYDPLGRMTSMTDHLGNAWSWTFDLLGRNTQKIDPDAGTWTFHYDDSGLLTSQTDAKGQTTTLAYDPAGRLATKTAGAVVMTWSQLRTGYYNVGRLTTVVSNSTTPPMTQTMDYDALGRMTKQTSTVDNLTYVAQRQYSAAGFLQAITYPDNDTVGTMQYDAAGRLKSIPGILTDVQYDAAGRPLQQVNTNGTTTTRTYTPQRGFLTHISTVGAITLQDLSYTPDPAGMVTQVTSPFPNEGWTYGYDELHRLTSSGSQTFQYDDIGRMTYNSLVGTYTYGTSPPHAPATVAGNPMTYDLNGNLTAGQGRTITWNTRNLPNQINGTQFNYDGLDTRVKKVSGSSVTLYPLGDDYEIKDGLITKYISVDGLGVIAKRVGTGVGATPYWLHTDRLGSIQAITNSSGVEVQRRTYRAYGDKIADTTGHVESRGHIDQRQDSETGLTYLHARYYDPVLGIFLSPDPLHPAKPGVGPNRYSYVFGNPVNGSDRSGLYWCPYPTRWCEDVDVTPGNGGNSLPSDRSGPYNGNNNITYWLWRTGRRSPAPGPSVPGPGSGQQIPVVVDTPAEPPESCRKCKSHEPWGHDNGNGGTPQNTSGKLDEHMSLVVTAEANLIVMTGNSYGLTLYVTPGTGDFGIADSSGKGYGLDFALNLEGGYTRSLGGDNSNINANPLLLGGFSLEVTGGKISGVTAGVGYPRAIGGSVTLTGSHAFSIPSMFRSLWGQAFGYVMSQGQPSPFDDY